MPTSIPGSSEGRLYVAFLRVDTVNSELLTPEDGKMIKNVLLDYVNKRWLTSGPSDKGVLCRLHIHFSMSFITPCLGLRDGTTPLFAWRMLHTCALPDVYNDLLLAADKAAPSALNDGIGTLLPSLAFLHH